MAPPLVPTDKGISILPSKFKPSVLIRYLVSG